MLKVRVKEGMPEGFFGFYNGPDGNGVRRRCGFEGAAGEEFVLVDAMTGPDNKRVIAVKAEDTFSSKWMEFWNGKEWIDHIPQKAKRGRPFQTVEPESELTEQ